MLVIVAVALVQARSRHLAALLATMPLTMPLAMWIVFSASGGSHQQTGAFVRSMMIGQVAGVVFVVACWLALGRQWPLPVVLLVGAVGWLVTVALVPLARSWWE
jgi:H+/Cl- antiporter ClcA